MLIDTDEGLASIFQRVKRIALVGESVKPERPSHQVMHLLLDAGIVVIPVKPGLVGHTLLGCKVVASLEAISVPVDRDDGFRQPSQLPDIPPSTLSIAATILRYHLNLPH